MVREQNASTRSTDSSMTCKCVYLVRNAKEVGGDCLHLGLQRYSVEKVCRWRAQEVLVYPSEGILWRAIESATESQHPSTMAQ